MNLCTECGFTMALPDGTVIEKGVKYCPVCGKASLIASCPRCNSAICAGEQRYCVSCGAHLVKEHREV